MPYDSVQAGEDAVLTLSKSAHARITLFSAVMGTILGTLSVRPEPTHLLVNLFLLMAVATAAAYFEHDSATWFQRHTKAGNISRRDARWARKWRRRVLSFNMLSWLSFLLALIYVSPKILPYVDLLR